MLTENELMFISSWDKPTLHATLIGKSLNHAMAMRRNLQQALAAYSKRHKFDIVQEGALSVIIQIERWSRQSYVRGRMMEIISRDWSYLKKGKASAKRIANEEFDKILKESNY